MTQRVKGVILGSFTRFSCNDFGRNGNRTEFRPFALDKA